MTILFSADDPTHFLNQSHCLLQLGHGENETAKNAKSTKNKNHLNYKIFMHFRHLLWLKSYHQVEKSLFCDQLMEHHT